MVDQNKSTGGSSKPRGRRASPRRPKRSSGRSRSRTTNKDKNTSNNKNKNDSKNTSNNKNKNDSKNKNKNISSSISKIPWDSLKKTLMAVSLTAAAQMTGDIGKDNDKDTTKHGEPGAFDMYLLAQSWAPRFCCVSEKRCKQNSMDGENALSTHGLWPAYTKPLRGSGRTYPAFCNPLLASKGSRSREEHEWNKHGTCTVLSREQYFEEEEWVASEGSDGVEGMHTLLEEAHGEAVSIEDIHSTFGEEGAHQIAIKADKFCRLEELTTCWSKDNNGKVGDQISCPDHVLGSARNSAVVFSKCRSVFLDTAGVCKFVTKDNLKELRSGASGPIP